MCCPWTRSIARYGWPWSTPGVVEPGDVRVLEPGEDVALAGEALRHVPAAGVEQRQLQRHVPAEARRRPAARATPRPSRRSRAARGAGRDRSAPRGGAPCAARRGRGDGRGLGLRDAGIDEPANGGGERRLSTGERLEPRGPGRRAQREALVDQLGDAAPVVGSRGHEAHGGGHPRGLRLHSPRFLRPMPGASPVRRQQLRTMCSRRRAGSVPRSANR